MRTSFASGVRQGAQGPPGASASAYPYLLSTAATPPAPDGKALSNTDTPSTATRLYLAYQDADGDVIAPLLRSITTGDILTVHDKTDASAYAQFRVTADALDYPADEYVEVPVAHIESTVIGKHNQRITIFHTMHGSAGPQGPPGPPGEKGDPAPPVSSLLLKSPYVYWRPGYYYDPRLVGTNAMSAAGATAARLTLIPMVIPQNLTIDRIAIYVSTASATAGTFTRLGLYASDSTGQPGALLIDAGTVPNDSVGVKEIAVSLPLTAGLYWPATWNKEGGSFSCACVPQAVQLVVSGASAPNSGTQPPGCYTLTQVGLTALPPTGAGLAGGSGTPPAVWLRVAP